MENKVVAKVNDIEITQGDVQSFLHSLGQQTAMQIQSQPDGMERVVYELVNQNLMYIDALEQNLQEDDAFKNDLEQAKKNLLIQYSVNKFLKDITVTDEEAKEYFEANQEQFKKPETMTASHILVEEEETANEILKKINDGLSFEDAALEYSTCPSKDRGGDLGQFARGSMVPEFEEVAFKSDLGIVDKPVKTEFGYHIIKVVEKNEAEESSFEEIKDQVKQSMIQAKQQQAYMEKTNELKEKYTVNIDL